MREINCKFDKLHYVGTVNKGVGTGTFWVRLCTSVLPHIIGNHNLKHNYQQNTNNKQTNKLNTLINRFISDEAIQIVIGT